MKNSETILPFSCCPLVFLWYWLVQASLLAFSQQKTRVFGGFVEPVPAQHAPQLSWTTAFLQRLCAALLVVLYVWQELSSKQDIPSWLGCSQWGRRTWGWRDFSSVLRFLIFFIYFTFFFGGGVLCYFLFLLCFPSSLLGQEQENAMTENWGLSVWARVHRPRSKLPQFNRENQLWDVGQHRVSFKHIKVIP